MVSKGADVTARDVSGSTTLMWAAYNEAGKPELVEELLRLGVDPNATNKAGETALTWAMRRGHTPVVSILKAAGATEIALIKDSAQRAIALLEKSGPQFVKGSACVSCHHQFLPQMTMASGRSRGFVIDEESARLQTESIIRTFKPVREAILQSKDRIPDPAITASYALLALASQNYPADETTAAMASLIGSVQGADGGFRAFAARPPIESSHFAATALSLRALQLYGPNGKATDEQVSRATAWLAGSKPVTTEDRAMQLLGMGWGNAKSRDIREKAIGLIAEQRPDGGWAQLPGLETDAYATGQALVALNRAAQIPVSDPVYQRGIAFLLRTQFSDGSWLVRTRAFPFQKYKESGFPHGKDQWISAAGTSWAAMAMSLVFPREMEESRLFSSAQQVANSQD
jgi:hypothetical protein